VDKASNFPVSSARFVLLSFTHFGLKAGRTFADPSWGRGSLGEGSVSVVALFGEEVMGGGLGIKGLGMPPLSCVNGRLGEGWVEGDSCDDSTGNDLLEENRCKTNHPANKLIPSKAATAAPIFFLFFIFANKFDNISILEDR
jgi:hypothetical protein